MLTEGTGIFLSVVGSLIVILLAIIGWLIKFGLDHAVERVCNEIKNIWGWIKEADEADKHNREEHAEFKGYINSLRERCHEMHPGGRRSKDPEDRP